MWSWRLAMASPDGGATGHPAVAPEPRNRAGPVQTRRARPLGGGLPKPSQGWDPESSKGAALDLQRHDLADPSGLDTNPDGSRPYHQRERALDLHLDHDPLHPARRGPRRITPSPLTAAPEPVPLLLQDIKKGSHANRKFGFSSAPPKGWNNIALKTDEAYLGAKYTSDRSTTGPTPA